MAKKQPAALTEPTKMPEDGSEKDYEAESAYRTIAQAHDHMKDPEMMKRVSKVASRQIATAGRVKRVSDIRDASRKMFPANLKYEKKADKDMDGE